MLSVAAAGSETSGIGRTKSASNTRGTLPILRDAPDAGPRPGCRLNFNMTNPDHHPGKPKLVQ